MAGCNFLGKSQLSSGGFGMHLKEKCYRDRQAAGLMSLKTAVFPRKSIPQGLNRLRKNSTKGLCNKGTALAGPITSAE